MLRTPLKQNSLKSCILTLTIKNTAFLTYIINVLFCLLGVLIVGVETMGRGRPTTLKNRQTTCISLEDRHRDFLKRHNKEASQCFRDYLDSLIQNEESPIEQLEREIEECTKIIEETEMLRAQKILQLKEIKELKEEEQIKQTTLKEFEENRLQYVLGCKNTILKDGKCTKLWLDHMIGAWKFENYEEAKEYAKNVWLENGVLTSKVNKFFGIKDDLRI